MPTSETTTPARKIARLTARQQYQLAEAITREQDRLRKEQPTVAETAEQFTRLLGFPVGPSSVRTAMEAAGVTWDTSSRARRREANRLDIDVYRSIWGEKKVELSVEPERRPDDRRLCGVSVPRDTPPAESAAWLRRVADMLDRHGPELQAVPMYGSDDPAVEEEHDNNYRRVQAGWAAILTAAGADGND